MDDVQRLYIVLRPESGERPIEEKQASDSGKEGALKSGEKRAGNSKASGKRKTREKRSKGGGGHGSSGKTSEKGSEGGHGCEVCRINVLYSFLEACTA